VIAVRLQDEEFFTVNLSRYASEMKVKMWIAACGLVHMYYHTKLA
jgi:hypothetical protein